MDLWTQTLGPAIVKNDPYCSLPVFHCVYTRLYHVTWEWAGVSQYLRTIAYLSTVSDKRDIPIFDDKNVSKHDDARRIDIDAWHTSETDQQINGNRSAE